MWFVNFITLLLFLIVRAMKSLSEKSYSTCAVSQHFENHYVYYVLDLFYLPQMEWTQKSRSTFKKRRFLKVDLKLTFALSRSNCPFQNTTRLSLAHRLSMSMSVVPEWLK